MSAAHRHPPAFQIECRRQARLQVLVMLLVIVSGACLIAGLAVHVASLAWLALALPILGWWTWQVAGVRARHLQWDGQRWRLGLAETLDPGQPVDIEVLFDFGDWLLLRAGQMDGALWPQRHYLPLARSAVGANWAQLRATLFFCKARASRVT